MTIRLHSMLSVGLAISALGCAARPPVVTQPAAPQAEASALPTTVFASNTALMPRAVTSFGAAELRGSVYAFGGYFGVPHAYNRDGQSGELWRLDPNTQTFELAGNAEPTQGAALVGAKTSNGDAVIRLGGMRARNAKGEPDDIISIDEVAAFSPDSKAWTTLPPLPAPRSSHAAAVLGQTVYVVGGWQLAGSARTGKFVDTTLALDLTNNTYRTIPQPFQLRALALAALDGKLVAVGGINLEGKVSKEVHVLDPASGAWTRAADFPVDGFGVAASSSGDVLFASARDGHIYSLPEPTGAWSKVSSLAFPRFFHQLVQLGPTRVLALGGISGMHGGPRIREIETVDVQNQAPRVLSFVVSNPTRARNRQGVFLEGDSLYVFGGNRSLAQHDFKPDDFEDKAARFDLAAVAWAPMAPYPAPRQTVQTLVQDEQVLALGGFGHDGVGPQARAHADAYHYDVEHDSWAADPSVLPTPRTQFGLATQDGNRWVFGGLDFKPEAQGEAQFEHPTSVLRAAPGQPFVASGVELPHARRAFGGAVLDGRYYLVGGMAGGFAGIPACDVFEFATSKWSEIPCPKSRISPQLVAIDGKLYLGGGSSAGEGGGLTPNRSLEVFDPKTNTWSTLIENLPIEARHLTMLPYAGGLVLYSAHDEEGKVHVAVIKP